MNDTREPIFNAQAIDIARDQQDRENMRQLIGLQKTRIQQLEAEVVDLKAQLATRQTVDEEVELTAKRDAWKNTHDPIFCRPLPLVDGIELTAEQAKMLETIANSARAEIDNDDIWGDLIDMGLIQYEYFPDTITDKGRAALAAYQPYIESEGE